MGTAAFFVGWLFLVSAGEQKGEGEAVKICGLGNGVAAPVSLLAEEKWSAA
jgi:hypothetical protein